MSGGHSPVTMQRLGDPSVGGLPAPGVAAFADALGGFMARARRVLLTGPIDPDGDSIGACLALQVGLRHRFPGVTVHVAGTPGYRYDWLQGADEMVPDDEIGPDYDLVVVMDGDRHRLEPPIDAAFRSTKWTAIVDHHRSTETDGYDIVLLDHTAASTCQMVYPLLQLWGVPIDRAVAELLYTGIIFDTGGFRHSNASPATHRLAARLLETGVEQAPICVRVLSERSASGLKLLGEVLQQAEVVAEGTVSVGRITRATFDGLGAQPEDLEGVVDALLHVRGVETACLFIEKRPGIVKLSLRSRSTVNCADLARRIGPGGGGHARAAGVILREPMESVWPRVIAELEAEAASCGLVGACAR